jgi:hypothetical protein
MDFFPQYIKENQGSDNCLTSIDFYYYERIIYKDITNLT